MEQDTTKLEPLREKHYNSTLTHFAHLHDDLAILRIRPDQRLEYQAGQYTVLGLGYWEPRIAGAQAEALKPGKQWQLVRRAYSISCRLLDDEGQRVDQPGRELEFYVALVRRSELRAPALTPRLFAKRRGDRLHVGTHAHGRYTLDGVQPTDNVLFCATGTGEAPHNSMIAELLRRQHRGRVASVVSVRYRFDLGYLNQHRALEHAWHNYRYLPLTTREPENLDRNHAKYVGKRYLQDYLQSGQLQDDAQFRIVPETTHVFLCGNPDMIGLPNPNAPEKEDTTQGMVRRLSQRGFQLDRPNHAGNIHVEQYW